MMFIRLRHSLFIIRPFYLGGGHLFERDIFTMSGNPPQHRFEHFLVEVAVPPFQSHVGRSRSKHIG